MSQSQIRESLDLYELWISNNNFSEAMFKIAIEARHDLIEQLLQLQIKEYLK